jgi:hypothetical protein
VVAVVSAAAAPAPVVLVVVVEEASVEEFQVQVLEESGVEVLVVHLSVVGVEGGARRVVEVVVALWVGALEGLL